MPAVAMLTSYHNIPTVGYLSASDDLNNKTKYTTLSRVSSGFGPMGEAIMVLLKEYNWKKVAIVRSAMVQCTSGLSGFYNLLGEGWLKKLQGEFFADTPAEIEQALEQVKKLARSKQQLNLKWQ